MWPREELRHDDDDNEHTCKKKLLVIYSGPQLVHRIHLVLGIARTLESIVPVLTSYAVRDASSERGNAAT
jgi:hypothetical protein